MTRATTVNTHCSRIFTNLAIVMVKNYFRPDRIYKMGENVLQPGP